MTLGEGKQVVIRLAPRYAPVHVANIRKLAASGWWDAASVYRVLKDAGLLAGQAPKPNQLMVQAMQDLLDLLLGVNRRRGGRGYGLHQLNHRRRKHLPPEKNPHRFERRYQM